MLTILPAFWANICRAASWVIWMNPSRLVDASLRKSSVVYSTKGLAMKIPALLTNAWIDPNRCTAVSTTRRAVDLTAQGREYFDQCQEPLRLLQDAQRVSGHPRRSVHHQLFPGPRGGKC